MEIDPTTPERWERLERGCLIAGGVGLGLCLIGAFFSGRQFFQSYLFAYVFWLGIALGSLGIVMLHNLTGGGWGVVIRRFVESAMMTLPLMALLFVPLLFGLQALYEWAHPETVAADALLRHKSPYLNVPFFIVRAVIYFALWIGFGWALARWSRDYETSADPRLIERQRAISAPGLGLYALTITFASIDWIMSLEPHWYSTIYGVHFFGGFALSALAFAILMAALLSHRSGVASDERFLDLGNLLLAFVMLWAYFTYSQWIIIWSGNLPEETSWYLRRNHGGWEWVVSILVVLHFAIPFLLLLGRSVKRRPGTLAAIAALIVFMRFVDIFWYTAPAFRPGAFMIHWMDIAAAIGIGGIWLGMFFRQLQRRPLLREPYAREVLVHG